MEEHSSSHGAQVTEGEKAWGDYIRKSAFEHVRQLCGAGGCTLVKYELNLTLSWEKK